MTSISDSAIKKHIHNWNLETKAGHWICPNKPCDCVFYLPSTFKQHIQYCKVSGGVFARAILDGNGIPCCFCSSNVQVDAFYRHITDNHRKVAQSLQSIHVGTNERCLNYKCKKKFTDGIAYLNHVMLCGFLICCEHCGKEFKSDKGLQLHLTQCKMSSNNAPSKIKSIDNIQLENPVEPLSFPCPTMHDNTPKECVVNVSSSGDKTARGGISSGSRTKDLKGGKKSGRKSGRNSSGSDSRKGSMKAGKRTKLSIRGETGMLMVSSYAREPSNHGEVVSTSPTCSDSGTTNSVSENQKREFLRRWYKAVMSADWFCPNDGCTAKFFLPVPFVKHLRDCNIQHRYTSDVLQRNTLPCPFCKKDIQLEKYHLHFKDKHSAVMVDVRSIQKSGSVICPNYTCKEVFTDGSLFLQHSLWCKPFYLCSSCGKEFLSKLGHKNHICKTKLGAKADLLKEGVIMDIVEEQKKLERDLTLEKGTSLTDNNVDKAVTNLNLATGDEKVETSPPSKPSATEQCNLSNDTAVTEASSESVPEHISSWYDTVRSGSWYCPNTTCKETFFIPCTMVTHIKTCSLKTMHSFEVVKNNRIPCSICKSDVELNVFTLHFKEKHGMILAELRKLMRGENIICPNYTCKKTFQEGTQYLKHALTCKPLFLCDTCNKDFFTRLGFNNHPCHRKRSSSVKRASSKFKEHRGEKPVDSRGNFSSPSSGPDRVDADVNNIQDSAMDTTHNQSSSHEENFKAPNSSLQCDVILKPVNIEDPKVYLKCWYTNVRSGIFECPNRECSARFFLCMRFVEHLKTCPLQESFCKEVVQIDCLPCPLCDAEVELDDYNKHLRQNHKQVFGDLTTLAQGKEITCPNYLCKKVFTSGEEYLCHSVVCKPAYLCSTCMQVFTSLRGIQDHPCTEVFGDKTPISQKNVKQESMSSSKVPRKTSPLASTSSTTRPIIKDKGSVSAPESSFTPTTYGSQSPVSRVKDMTEPAQSKDWYSDLRKGILRCPRESCQRRFFTPYKFTKHLKICSPQEKLLCPFCQKEIRADLFSTHTRNNHKVEAGNIVDLNDNVSVTCPNYKCQMVFNNGLEYISHAVQCRPLYYCDNCYREYKTPSYVSSHNCVVKEEKDPLSIWYSDIKRGNFRCPEEECRKSFYTVTSFVKHVQQCVTEDSYFAEVLKSSLIPCPLCDCRGSLEVFRRHFKEDHDQVWSNTKNIKTGGRGVCHKCGKGLWDGVDYMKHVATCRSLKSRRSLRRERGLLRRDFKSDPDETGNYSILDDGNVSDPKQSWRTPIASDKTGNTHGNGQKCKVNDEHCASSIHEESFHETGRENIDQDYLNAWYENFRKGIMKCPNISCQDDFFLPRLFVKHLCVCQSKEPYCAEIRKRNELSCPLCMLRCPVLSFKFHFKDNHRVVSGNLRSLARFETVQCQNYKCQQEFSDGKEYLKHAVSCQPLYLCEICFSEFKTLKSIGRHKCTPSAMKVKGKTTETIRKRQSSERESTEYTKSPKKQYDENAKAACSLHNESEEELQVKLNTWYNSFREGALQCPSELCQMEFDLPDSLVKHIRNCPAKGKLLDMISKVGTLPCMLCKKWTPIIRHSQHFRTRHRAVHARLIKCEKGLEVLCSNHKCQRKFSNPKDYLQHVSTCSASPTYRRSYQDTCSSDPDPGYQHQDLVAVHSEIEVSDISGDPSRPFTEKHPVLASIRRVTKSNRRRRGSHQSSHRLRTTKDRIKEKKIRSVSFSVPLEDETFTTSLEGPDSDSKHDNECTESKRKKSRSYIRQSVNTSDSDSTYLAYSEDKVTNTSDVCHIKSKEKDRLVSDKATLPISQTISNIPEVLNVESEESFDIPKSQNDCGLSCAQVGQKKIDFEASFPTPCELANKAPKRRRKCASKEKGQLIVSFGTKFRRRTTQVLESVQKEKVHNLEEKEGKQALEADAHLDSHDVSSSMSFVAVPKSNGKEEDKFNGTTVLPLSKDKTKEETTSTEDTTECRRLCTRSMGKLIDSIPKKDDTWEHKIKRTETLSGWTKTTSESETVELETPVTTKRRRSTRLRQRLTLKDTTIECLTSEAGSSTNSRRDSERRRSDIGKVNSLFSNKDTKPVTKSHKQGDFGTPRKLISDTSSSVEEVVDSKKKSSSHIRESKHDVQKSQHRNVIKDDSEAKTKEVMLRNTNQIYDEMMSDIETKATQGNQEEENPADTEKKEMKSHNEHFADHISSTDNISKTQVQVITTAKSGISRPNEDIVGDAILSSHSLVSEPQSHCELTGREEMINGPENVCRDLPTDSAQHVDTAISLVNVDLGEPDSVVVLQNKPLKNLKERGRKDRDGDGQAKCFDSDVDVENAHFSLDKSGGKVEECRKETLAENESLGTNSHERSEVKKDDSVTEVNDLKVDTEDVCRVVDTTLNESTVKEVESKNDTSVQVEFHKSQRHRQEQENCNLTEIINSEAENKSTPCAMDAKLNEDRVSPTESNEDIAVIDRSVESPIEKCRDVSAVSPVKHINSDLCNYCDTQDTHTSTQDTHTGTAQCNESLFVLQKETLIEGPEMKPEKKLTKADKKVTNELFATYAKNGRNNRDNAGRENVEANKICSSECSLAVKTSPYSQKLIRCRETNVPPESVETKGEHSDDGSSTVYVKGVSQEKNTQDCVASQANEEGDGAKDLMFHVYTPQDKRGRSKCSTVQVTVEREHLGMNVLDGTEIQMDKDCTQINDLGSSVSDKYPRKTGRKRKQPLITSTPKRSRPISITEGATELVNSRSDIEEVKTHDKAYEKSIKSRKGRKSRVCEITDISTEATMSENVSTVSENLNGSVEPDASDLIIDNMTSRDLSLLKGAYVQETERENIITEKANEENVSVHSPSKPRVRNDSVVTQQLPQRATRSKRNRIINDTSSSSFNDGIDGSNTPKIAAINEGTPFKLDEDIVKRKRGGRRVRIKVQESGEEETTVVTDVPHSDVPSSVREDASVTTEPVCEQRKLLIKKRPNQKESKSTELSKRGQKRKNKRNLRVEDAVIVETVAADKISQGSIEANIVTNTLINESQAATLSLPLSAAPSKANPKGKRASAKSKNKSKRDILWETVDQTREFLDETVLDCEVSNGNIEGDEGLNLTEKTVDADEARPLSDTVSKARRRSVKAPTKKKRKSKKDISSETVDETRDFRDETVLHCEVNNGNIEGDEGLNLMEKTADAYEARLPSDTVSKVQRRSMKTPTKKKRKSKKDISSETVDEARDFPDDTVPHSEVKKKDLGHDEEFNLLVCNEKGGGHYGKPSSIRQTESRRKRRLEKSVDESKMLSDDVSEVSGVSQSPDVPFAANDTTDYNADSDESAQRKRGRKKKRKGATKRASLQHKASILEQLEKSEELKNAYQEWWNEFSQAKFKCANQDCGQEFISCRLLFSHMRKCTVGILTQVVKEKGEIPCFVCKRTEQLPRLLTHVRAMHHSVFRLLNGVEESIMPPCENYSCNAKVETVSDALKHGQECGFLQRCPCCHRELKVSQSFEKHVCIQAQEMMMKVSLNYANGAFSIVTEQLAGAAKRVPLNKKSSLVGLEDEGVVDNKEDEYVADEASQELSESEGDSDVSMTTEGRMKYHNKKRKIKKQGKVDPNASSSPRYGLHVKHLFHDKVEKWKDNVDVLPGTDNHPFYISWLKEHQSDVLFQEYKPSLDMMELVKSSDQQSYLPTSNSSPVFNIIYETSDRHRVASQDYTLSLFETAPPLSESDNQTFYTGGPIWAMDWCPCPGDQDQFLAVSVHRNHSDVFTCSIAEKCNGMLQIWHMPRLNQSGSVAQPRMVMGIAHNHGPVYSLNWCPSGTWESKSEEDWQLLNRIGILAVAFGDGSIQIFSVPYPEQLRKSLDLPEEALLIVKMMPCLKLIARHEKPGVQVFKAMSLAWQPTKGHGRIIGGFGDGTLCLWKVDKISSLLCDDPPHSKTRTVLPVISFPAHDLSVRSLSWCPSDPNFIVSGGGDRDLKIFDLRNPQFPMLITKRGYVHCIRYGLQRSGFAVSEDGAFCCLPGGARYFELMWNAVRDCTGLCTTLVTRHKAGVKALGSSEWFDAFVTGCDNGFVIIRSCVQERGTFGARRSVVISKLSRQLTTEDSSASESLDREGKTSGQNEVSQDKNGNEKRDLMEIASEDTKDVAKILGSVADSTTKFIYSSKYTFRDTNFLEFRSKPKCCRQEVDPTNPNFGQSAANPLLPDTQCIHRVSWNPNFGSHMWIAIGTRLGLVRLHPLWRWTKTSEK